MRYADWRTAKILNRSRAVDRDGVQRKLFAAHQSAHCTGTGKSFCRAFFKKRAGFGAEPHDLRRFSFAKLFSLRLQRPKRKASKESCKTIPRRRSRDRMNFDTVKIHSATVSRVPFGRGPKGRALDLRRHAFLTAFSRKSLAKSFHRSRAADRYDVPRKF